jgi:hypothetical protein
MFLKVFLAYVYLETMQDWPSKIEAPPEYIGINYEL